MSSYFSSLGSGNGGGSGGGGSYFNKLGGGGGGTDMSQSQLNAFFKSKPAKKSGGGGLLKVVNKIPGATTVEHGLSAAGHGIAVGADKTLQVTENIGTGLYDYGAAAVAPGSHPSWGKLASEYKQFVTHPLGEAKQEYKTDPFVKMTVDQYAPLAHPERNITQTVLAAALLAAPAIASTAARGVYIADIAKAAKVGQGTRASFDAADHLSLVKQGSEAAQAYSDTGFSVTPLTAGEKAGLRVKALNPRYKPPTALRTLNVPQRVLEHPSATVLDETGNPVAVRAAGPAEARIATTTERLQQSGSQIGRLFQYGHDTVVQRALDNMGSDPGLVARYGLKRVAKSESEAGRLASNMRNLPTALLNDAGTRSPLEFATGQGSFDRGLSQQEGQLALQLRSWGVTPDDAAKYWADHGVTDLSAVAQSLHEKGVLVRDAAGKVAVDESRFPKLANAEALTAENQAVREGAISEDDRMNPAGQQNRLDLPARVVAGGHYVAPTGAKLGKPSQGLVKMRAYVSRLEGLHDRATARVAAAGAEKLGPKDALIGAKIVGPGAEKVSSTAGAVGEAAMRLAQLEKEHNAALDKLAAAKFGSVDASEVSRRNLGNTKAARQESGRTRNGNLSGASGHKAVHRPTVKSERRKLIEQEITDALARNPHEPALQSMARRAAEIDRLRGLVNPEFGEKARGIVTQPGRVVAAPGAVRAERIGSALSVARDRLQQMEAAAANREAPTGIVGGEAGIGKGQGFVSLRTSRKAQAQTGFIQSRTNIIRKTKPLELGQPATGSGIVKGLIPSNTTHEVARATFDALRKVNTDELRAGITKFGSDVRSTTDDVLVADPAALKLGDVPENIQVLLGMKESTVSEAQAAVGVTRALQALLEDHIPGLKDNFAADKAKGIGERAPEGFKWVPRSLLPDDLTKVSTARGKIEKSADALNSAVTAATVYFKLGHVPTRAFTNATTNVLQGSAAPSEIMRTFKMVKQLGGMNSRLVREFDSLTGGHAYTALPHAGTSRIAKVAGYGARGFAKHIDAPFRINSIFYELRSIGVNTPAEMEKVLAQVKDPGRAGMDAAKAARVDWAIRRANRAAIMYDGMSATERRHVARYLWFWPWTKGAARFTGHTLVEHPLKAYTGIQLGVEGAKYQQQQLGNVPSYEYGLTPLGFNIGGQPATANFASFVPFGTTGQLAQTVASPQKIVDQFNPAYTGLAQAVSDSLEGKGTGKAVSDFFSKATAPTPEAQAITAATNPQGSGFFPTSSKYIFGKSWQSALARAAAGTAFPRPVNKAALNKDAAREHQKKRTITIYGG